MFSAFILAVATGTPKVIRHLDFHFGINVQTQGFNHTSGIGGPISGMDTSTASGSNEGTITVDVVGLRPDGGLVVNVSEISREIGHADGAQCITWGIGTVICEPGKQTSPEEQGLLRFMGRNFINASNIDANNHWSVGTSGKSQTESSDYRITSSANGMLNVSFQRVTKSTGVQAFNATTHGSLIYDENLTVPREIDEDSILRTDSLDGDVAPGGYEEVHTMLNLKLLDDSMTKRP